MANRKPDHSLLGQESKQGLTFLHAGKESVTDRAIAALRQLESDIRYFQEKSESAEGELRNRDIRIEQLMSDLESSDTRIQGAEVDSERAKIRVLQEELGIVNEELKTENADLRRKVQDLEFFIEGQQEEWTELNKRLLDYQDRLAGMQQQVENGEAAASAQEEGDLARRILELESRCVEQENARDLLQKTLDRRTGQVAQLSSKIGRMECRLSSAESETSEDGDPFNVESLDFLPSDREAEESAQCEQFDLLEAEPDMIDIFGLCEDSVIDIGIGEEPEDERDSLGKLQILPMPARQVLIAICPGAEDGRQFLLSKAETTIGRSRNSDICIASKFISREHARIIREDTRIIIEDLGSTNGFLINSEEKRRHQLQHGDRLKIGTDEFEFLDLPACQ